MPKRSKEDTEVTIQTIMDAVVDQLLRLGYDKMSYTTLSQQTGVSRTGISHHFPKKTDFASALDGRIFKMFPNSTAKCDTRQYQAANAISLNTIAGCLKPKHFLGR
ncbi:transcriptional regulator, TetR family [Vibrio cholerae]|nr:transcriptional regulator, TetR family [Vibrio cholerae]